MSKHTPGPWELCAYKVAFPGRIVPISDTVFGKEIRSDGPIADVLCPVTMDIGTYEANCLLIAASPDLLKALDIAYGLIVELDENKGRETKVMEKWWHEGGPGAVQFIEDAIRKARKEGE